MKQSCSGSSARPNTSSGLQQFTQQRAAEHLWTLAANFFLGSVWLHCSPWTFSGRIRKWVCCLRQTQRCEVRGCLRRCALRRLPLRPCYATTAVIAGRGFSEKMEIKWDILLLLLCLSQGICRQQYSAAIYHRDPLILTNLIKETHWQPSYLWGSHKRALVDSHFRWVLLWKLAFSAIGSHRYYSLHTSAAYTLKSFDTLQYCYRLIIVLWHLLRRLWVRGFTRKVRRI